MYVCMFLLTSCTKKVVSHKMFSAYSPLLCRLPVPVPVGRLPSPYKLSNDFLSIVCLFSILFCIIQRKIKIYFLIYAHIPNNCFCWERKLKKESVPINDIKMELTCVF